jgi:hypothetical protein
LAFEVPAQTAAVATLRGVVTDPSGALVPGALVQLRGPGGEKRATADEVGRYAFTALRPGSYTVRVIAKGFTVSQRLEFAIASDTVLDVQLTIEASNQVINVDDEAKNLSADPSSNASAIILREKELATLSDDPDELEQQLQAMAGPAAGPNGGQIFIDGFTGGRMPPKSSIREVRINSNPYSPEYDRPGFGRIEILTRPGSDFLRGQAFIQFNDESFNSRSPLLTQSTRPPYQQRFYGFNLSGPIRKQKASFGFDIERRSIEENALILATTLDAATGNLSSVNQPVVTPQTRTSLSPRFDYTINPNNTLVLRYQHARSTQENEGVGDFALPSRAFTRQDSEHTVQLTETSIIGAKAVNELRFQFQRGDLSQLVANSDPALSVQGAFEGGGAQVGNSGSLTNSFEVSNITTYNRGTHTMKFGARLRRSALEDTSVNNFGGTYAFFGGVGPQLDANNQVVAGTSMQLAAIERYRRTLLFLEAGWSDSQIRAAGGGASQFSLGAGIPTTAVNQVDVGLFINDDWRVRPNLTVSYGLRYEAQTNIGDRTNFAPRVGIAWGIDGGSGRSPKTVLRAGFGSFFDRVSNGVTLRAMRFDGTTQQSYLILNPSFFPVIPSASVLQSGLQPQRLQLLDDGLRAPRNYQTSIGVDRQLGAVGRVSVQYVHSRATNVERTRNINTPIGGVYPFGDTQFRLLTETTGFSRSHQLFVSPSINYKKLFLFGFYSLSDGNTDAEGTPADPYNLRAEWGPSRMAGVRHRFVMGTSLPMPWKVSVSPFVMASSGTPYTITTGRDLNGDGFTSERPALLSGVAAAACNSGSLVYSASFGCFDLNPAPGTSIGRNSFMGPSNFNLNLRLSRTWSFGKTGESGNGDGMPPGMGGLRGPGGGGPPPGGGGGGGGGMRGGGGPPPGVFGPNSGRKYNLMLSLSARNILNRANYGPPNGDLSSPFFDQYRSLAGFGPFGASTTYNRKLDLQLRFTF